MFQPCASHRWFSCLLLAICAGSLHAQNTYFVTTASSGGAGSLPVAVAAMQNNGTTQTLRFQLPANSTIALAASLPELIGAQVEILGIDAPGLIIDGNGFRIFRFNGQSLLMRDLTLRNGRDTAAGCLSSNTTISTQIYDSRFLNCRTDGSAASGSGGGALFSFGSLRLTRTRFENNAAYDGGINNLSLSGGAVSFSGSSLLIENSTFVGNQTVRTPAPAGNCIDGTGAALSITMPAGSSVSIVGSGFENNSHRCGSSTGSISGQGGAISVFGPSSGTAPPITIDSSFFGGNRADNGAGIFARAVALTLFNSSFHDNIGRAAGAVFLTTGFGTPPAPELRVRSSTFWRNATSISTFGADLTLNAAVLVRQYFNVLHAAPLTGESCAPATFNSDAGDVVFTTGNSCFVNVGASLISAQFAAGFSFGLLTPANNGGSTPSMDLAPSSVAIDNGTANNCPTRDGRGATRPYDGDNNGVAICDVGAIEYRLDPLFSSGFE